MRVRKTNDQPDTHFSRTGKVLGFKKFGWKARDTVPFKDYKIHGCMSVDLLLHKQMTLMFLCTVYIEYHSTQSQPVTIVSVLIKKFHQLCLILSQLNESIGPV